MNTLSAQAPRLLVIGAGDVAWRALPWLLRRFRVFALCRSPQTAARWRAAGALPIIGDLDDRSTLARLRGLATHVLHTAPPAQDRLGDPRTQRLLAALGSAAIIPRALVYISTTGVYGDCEGARIDETRPRLAGSPRARRRVAAEDGLRTWLGRWAAGSARGRRPPAIQRGLRAGGRRAGLAGADGPALGVLRAPGIYAAERLPVARLRAGTPALHDSEDVYTSHIHANDLAAAAGLALFRVRGGRALHVCDDSEVKMGDWFGQVAATFGLPAPARISRAQAERMLPESLLSFMRESRRLANGRMKTELGLRLHYPTVAEGLAAAIQCERVLPIGAHGGGRSGEQQGHGSQIAQHARPEKQ